MPRAAAPLEFEEGNLPDNINSANGEQVEVRTILRSAVTSASAEGPAAPARSWTDVSSVATAFLTNLSGGAACYDVDMGLVANDAINEELTQAIGNMRRLMAVADAASWRIADVAESSVVVVATATTSSGDDSSTHRQPFTLHIDVAAATHPITNITTQPITNITAHPQPEASNQTASLGPPTNEPEPVGLGWGVRVGRR